MERSIRRCRRETGFDLIVDPPGVQVKLDGRPIGKAPLQIRNLAPGDHEVEIEAPAGFFNKTQTVAVDAGKAERVFIPLDAMEVVASFTSEPPGARYVLLADGEEGGGRDAGRGPSSIPRKRYEVGFKKEGFAGDPRDRDDRPVGRLGRRRAGAERRGPAPGRPSAMPAPRRGAAAGPAGGRAPSRSARSREAGRPAPKPAADAARRAPTATGMLSLGAKPPCRIFIDGRDTGQKTPLVDIELKAGKHRITLGQQRVRHQGSFRSRSPPASREGLQGPDRPHPGACGSYALIGVAWSRGRRAALPHDAPAYGVVSPLTGPPTYGRCAGASPSRSPGSGSGSCASGGASSAQALR